MFLKKIMLPIALICATTIYADEQANQVAINLGWLYLKPTSNNHTYAYYVSGTQPYNQSWHAQAINPSHSSAFELGLEYIFQDNKLGLAGNWVHLHSTDSANKQGNQTLEVANIEFVAPPFEMSPPVFGIRHAEAQLSYNYDDFMVNLEKILTTPTWMHAKIIAGIKVLRLKQTMDTTFSDLVGAEPTPYTYPLTPDPSFSFEIQSISNFIGVGPDLGLTAELEILKGLSVVGAAFASLNVGTTSIQENFTSTSQSLTQLGIGVSEQQVTTPNKTQIVPGFDGKLGLRYQFKSLHNLNTTLEAGYRLISYINAISTTNPQTLVQPGQNPSVPEFSTGTMAIVSMTQQDRPFNMNGPYLELKLTIV